MTNDEIDAIRARLEAATNEAEWAAINPLGVWLVGLPNSERLLFKFPGGALNCAADAAFVSNAGRDIRALLAEVERLLAHEQARVAAAVEGRRVAEEEGAALFAIACALADDRETI